MNILYVEDNTMDAELVERYINMSTDHHAIIASTLSDAWEVLEEQDIDLIMIDIVLDGKRDGFAFAFQLRQKDFPQPLIAVTALSTPEDKTLLQKAGFDTVIIKPFSIEKLDQILSEFII